MTGQTTTEITAPYSNGTEVPVFTPEAYVYRKIARVMGDLQRLPETGFNKEHNYRFTTSEDIEEAVRVSMAKHNLAIIPNMDQVEQETFTTQRGSKGVYTKIQFSFTIACGDTGATIVRRWVSEANDYGDKGINKASTIARKFFLKKLFGISSGEDVDPDAESIEGERSGLQAREPRRAPEQPRRSDPDSARMNSGSAAEPDLTEIGTSVVKVEVRQTNGKPWLFLTCADGKPAAATTRQPFLEAGWIDQTDWTAGEHLLTTPIPVTVEAHVGDGGTRRLLSVSRNDAGSSAPARPKAKPAVKPAAQPATKPDVKPTPQTSWSDEDELSLGESCWSVFENALPELLKRAGHDPAALRSTFANKQSAWHALLVAADQQQWPMVCDTAIYDGRQTVFQTPVPVRAYGRTSSFKALAEKGAPGWYEGNSIGAWEKSDEPYEFDPIRIHWKWAGEGDKRYRVVEAIAPVAQPEPDVPFDLDAVFAAAPGG